MVPFDSASFCKSALRADAPIGEGTSCPVRGEVPLETLVAGSSVFDAASLEPILDFIKDAPRDVQASIYVFYCEAISNVIHHAYSDEHVIPKFWWTAGLEINPATSRYVFTVSDEGRGLGRSLPFDSNRDGHKDAACWRALLSCPGKSSREARGQGLASFTRLAKTLNGGRLTVESEGDRYTYSEDAGGKVSKAAAARKGVRVALDVASETLWRAA